MTRQQNIALANPCVVAEDCVKDRYKFYDQRWSVILTVNTGFE